MVRFTLSMEIPGADTPDMHRTADCQLVVVLQLLRKHCRSDRITEVQVRL